MRLRCLIAAVVILSIKECAWTAVERPKHRENGRTTTTTTTTNTNNSLYPNDYRNAEHYNDPLPLLQLSNLERSNPIPIPGSRPLSYSAATALKTTSFSPLKRLSRSYDSSENGSPLSKHHGLENSSFHHSFYMLPEPSGGFSWPPKNANDTPANRHRLADNRIYVYVKLRA